MSEYAGENIVLTGVDGTSFEAVRRGYELQVATPRPGEKIFTALGEYAIQQPSGELWQLLPAAQRPKTQLSQGDESTQWATAEDLRTWAGEGIFSSNHMDLIDAALFHDRRVTSPITKLIIANEDDLQALLAEYAIPTDQWHASSPHDLYNYIRPSDKPEAEDVALHRINNELWLASAQTMLNVFHETPNGHTYKLQETEVIYFDSDGNELSPVKSTTRSSMGETSHLIDGRPERPFVAARRALREELSIEDNGDILRIISTGSLLRLKEAGHHRFGPIKAEDRTPYFRVDLNP